MGRRELSGRVHRLKITLDGTKPPVWRRVEVPAVTGLHDLHMLIQTVMGWENCHLHSFEFKGRRYSESGEDLFGFRAPDRDESEARVGDVLRRTGAKGTYLYDFGDDWRHTVTVEEITDARPDTAYPRLLDGRGGCPPEDCGGVGGFEYLRHLREHPDEIQGGYHGDVEEQQGWVDLLEPDDLDLEKARRELRAAFGALALDEAEPVPDEDVAPARPVSLPPVDELARAALDTPLLRDALRLAEWTAPATKLTGTGVPRPADARAAVEELGLWPTGSEEEAAERAEKLTRLRSAKDIPRFLQPWTTAVELGLIAVASATARPAPELAELTETPERVLRLWSDLFTGIVDNTPDSGGGWFGPVIDGPEVLTAALVLLYDEPDESEVPLARLAEDLVFSTDQADALTEKNIGPLHEAITSTLYEMALRLAETGGIRLIDRGPAEVTRLYRSHGERLPAADWAGAQDQEIDCSVVLTPLGRYGTREILLAAGVPAPLMEDLAGAGAAELLDTLGTAPPGVLASAVQVWAAERTPQEAVREIADAAVEPSGVGPLRRTAATLVLEAVGAEAVPALRGLLASDRPAVAALAASALLSVGAVSEKEREKLFAEHGAWIMIDMVSVALEAGEQHLAALLAADDGEDHALGGLILDNADQLWRTGHPAATEVLEALGRLHPDKRIAKAARRAAHKARSRR